MGIGTKYGITAETGNNIQTIGLVAYWDAAYKKSYTSSSLDTYNLASGSLTPTGSLKNDIGFSNDNQGSWILDGADDYVDFGNDSVLDFGTTSFSVSFWIKTTNNSGAVLAKGSVSGQSKAGYKFEMAATNKIQIWNVNQSAVATYLTSTVIVSDGAWHYIAASYDRGAANLLSLYIDGSLDVTKDITSMGDLSNTYNLFLGKQDNGADWDGNISNTQIYNRALTSGDILQNYNAQKDRFGY